MAAVDAVIDPLAPRLDALAATFFVEHRQPGLVAGVVHDGAVAWVTALGFADRATARPMTADTLFRVASITKSFTATAVLQLRDDGQLRLDDPLVTYVPEARAIADPFGPIEEVTIRRLLLHTSGLQGEVPIDDPWDWTFSTDDELLGRLDRAAVLAAPETGFRYSNMGYQLLGIAVGRVAGEPFAEYLQRHVLDVAGLSSTTFYPSADLAARTATGYGPRRHTDELLPSRSYDSATMYADGGLWSTVPDLARWVTVHSRTADDDRRGEGDRVLDGPTLREMQRAAVIADDAWSFAQGFGWRTTRVGDDAWVGHTGSLNGFRSLVVFRPKERVGVVALVNGSARPTLYQDIAKLILEAHRAAGPSVPSSPPAPTPEAWRELLGTYRNDDYGFALRVEVRDGALMLVDDDDPTDSSTLTATEDPLAYSIASGDLSGEHIRFMRGKSGAIAGINAAGGPARKLVPMEAGG
jgi:CubicO group peptidase (beta-lactamase class C family)